MTDTAVNQPYGNIHFSQLLRFGFRESCRRPKWLDENGDCPVVRLKDIAVEQGWNAGNASIEIYQWRKHMGSRRRRRSRRHRYSSPLAIRRFQRGFC